MLRNNVGKKHMTYLIHPGLAISCYPLGCHNLYIIIFYVLLLFIFVRSTGNYVFDQHYLKAIGFGQK